LKGERVHQLFLTGELPDFKVKDTGKWQKEASCLE
jgi:hypothetical protein